MSVVTLEFLRAAALGDINRLRAFLAQGVDINSTNKANQTALMLASAFKQAEIVKFLLTAGANANCHDELGLTATDWAQDQPEIIQLINSAERLRGSQPSPDAKPTPLVQTTAPVQSSRDDLNLESVILRANKRYAQTVSPALAATAAAKAPLTSAISDVDNDQTVDSLKPAPTEITVDTPHRAPSRIIGQTVNELPKSASRVDIALPQPPQTISRATRILFRVSIVIFLLVAGFISYHLLTRRASDVQTEPTPISVPISTTAKPKQTKAAPVVGGELAGTELFLADAEYPRDATVETGNVTVDIKVSRKGIVVSSKALLGVESLRAAAEKAAKGSAFSPDKLQDKSSLTNGTITYNFIKPENIKQPAGDFGFITDASVDHNVSAVAGGPLAGAERKLVVPQLPKRAKIENDSMTLVVRVSRTGKVKGWRPLNGDSHLRAFVIKAARNSTFDPDKLPGEGDVVGIITYKFQ